MVRFKDDKIVIEIPAASPFEHWTYLQTAISEVIREIDFSQAGSEQLSTAIWSLADLQKALVLEPEQAIAISGSMKKIPELKKAFC